MGHGLDICLTYADSGGLCGALDDSACANCEDYSDPVLLGGISSARHLELISKSQNVSYYT